MNKQRYHKIEEFFTKHSNLYNILKISYKLLPAIIFTSYILFIIILAFIYGIINTIYLKVVLVPLCVFVTVSIFRKLFNLQRPYEKMKITPLIPKDKKGQSFPSRHVASGFIISMAFLYVNPILGIIFIVISFLIALTRVLSGVHFIKDVIAGALYSLITSWYFIFFI